MSHSLVEDIGYLFSEISNRDNNLLNEESDYYDEEISSLTEEILFSICYGMASEGYSANAILDFLANSSEQNILEYYLNSNLIESSVSQEYILEQLEILDEGIGSAFKIIGKGLASTAKQVGRTTKVAVKRAVGPGVRKNIKAAVSKVKDIGTKAKELGGKVKTAAPTVAKGALIAGTGVLAGYGGAKLSGGGGGGVAKPQPSGGAPKPKGGAGYVDVPGKGKRYYASSDKKYYKNYNDALAAMKSRRGVTPAAPSAAGGGGGGSSASGGGTGGGGFAKPAPAKAKPAAKIEKSAQGYAVGTTAGGTKFERRAATSAELAASKAAGGGEAGVKAAVERGTKLMGGEEGPGKVEPKSVETDVAAEKARQKKRAESATKKESYDFYDVVLQYLFDTEQVESVAEANYVMSEMSEEDINLIVENYQLV